jgi:hypothetical protein
MSIGRPLVTALGFLPAGALVAVMALRIGPFATRAGVSRVLVAGMAMFLPGYALAEALEAEAA